MPIGSAAAACADLNAHLPLPLNRAETRLYRAVFDELGANGTVALRGDSGFRDSKSGKPLSYNELDELDQINYIGMAPKVIGRTKWNSYQMTEQVYAVCEKITCRSESAGTSNKDSSKSFFIKKTKEQSKIRKVKDVVAGHNQITIKLHHKKVC